MEDVPPAVEAVPDPADKAPAQQEDAPAQQRGVFIVLNEDNTLGGIQAIGVTELEAPTVVGMAAQAIKANLFG